MRATLSFHIFVLFVAGQLFSGCAPSTVNQLKKSTEAKQLSSVEILALARGNTLFLRGNKPDSYFYFDQYG